MLWMFRYVCIIYNMYVCFGEMLLTNEEKGELLALLWFFGRNGETSFVFVPSAGVSKYTATFLSANDEDAVGDGFLGCRVAKVDWALRRKCLLCVGEENDCILQKAWSQFLLRWEQQGCLKTVIRKTVKRCHFCHFFIETKARTKGREIGSIQIAKPDCNVAQWGLLSAHLRTCGMVVLTWAWRRLKFHNHSSVFKSVVP